MALAKLAILLLTTVALSLYHQNSELNVIHQHRKNRLNTISVPPQFEDLPLIPDPSITPIPSPYSSHISIPPSIAPIPSPYSWPIPTHSIPSSDSNNIYNVIAFGAVGDGKTDDTKAFDSAWTNACSQSVRSMLLVPQGYMFRIQPTVFLGPCKNALIFQIEGVIKAPGNPDVWPTDSKDSWLVFSRIVGLTVQGSGLIHGNGKNWWSRGNIVKPVMLRFYACTSLTIQGYAGTRLKVQNSAQFHFVIDTCKNVTVDSISINSPATSPNTDGIHLASQYVWIQNSDISNGDDCISMGDGTQNIHINNMRCLNGHGISIGSLGAQNSRACVTDVTVTNSFISNSTNGLRIKTWQGGSGSVSSITYQNVKMDTVRYPIIVDQFYCPNSNSCKNSSSNLLISDITYDTIVGTYIADRPPVYLACSNTVPCVGITIGGLNLSPAMNDNPSEPYCSNSYGLLATATVPPVQCLRQGPPKNLQSLLATKGQCLA